MVWDQLDKSFGLRIIAICNFIPQWQSMNAGQDIKHAKGAWKKAYTILSAFY